MLRNTKPLGFFVMVFLLVLVGGHLVSCRQNTTASSTQTSVPFINKIYESGPLRLGFSVGRRDISVADRLTVVLESAAPEDYGVEFPAHNDHLGKFSVVSTRAFGPELVENGYVKVGQTIVLEPFLAGQYKIPPMQVRFRHQEKKGTINHELTTEEITITVNSLLPKDAQVALNDILPPLQSPQSHPLYWMLGAVFLLLSALAAFWYFRRRKNGNAEPPPLPPHTLAYQELDALIANGLVEKGAIKLFYIRVSEILRRYIESRFGLRAPERTTEEFLTELSFTDSLLTQHKELLQKFLSHCDLVKFAKYLPSSREAGETVDLCRSFIQETEPPPEPMEKGQ